PIGPRSKPRCETSCGIRSPSVCISDTASPQVYTLSLHDALPIYLLRRRGERLELLLGELGEERNLRQQLDRFFRVGHLALLRLGDRKSTRLNSSHVSTSYAVFCLKKKTQDPPVNSVVHLHTTDER